MARKKRKTVLSQVTLEKYAAEGKSIARLEDGKTLFVEGGVPGDIVEVLVLKNKSSYAEGKVMRIETPSPNRVDAFCTHFGICGGCKWQMLPYDLQIEYKAQQVEDQLKRIGRVALPPFMPIAGSSETQFYRNKLEFTFSARSYLTKEELDAATGQEIIHKSALGFHAPGMFDKVVDVGTCYLQPEPTNILKNLMRTMSKEMDLPYYDFKLQQGWLRNLMIRVATTGEILVNLVVHHERPELKVLLDAMLVTVPEITSLNYTINPKVNDSIYDLEVNCYHGRPYIEEVLGDYRFKISPKSFFQTNSKQAKILYDITKSFAGLTGTEVVYDLYCGTGSIGIYCSKDAKSIIGIEVVEDAIKDAKENAKLNNVENAIYYAGDVSKIVDEAFFEKHGKPDVIITDPPRAGMTEKLIQQLLQIEAPKVVYVSCNPATQARDLALLDAKYSVEKVQPVDMFPHTHHIENVVLLQLKPQIEDDSIIIENDLIL